MKLPNSIRIVILRKSSTIVLIFDDLHFCKRPQEFSEYYKIKNATPATRDDFLVALLSSDRLPVR